MKLMRTAGIMIVLAAASAPLALHAQGSPARIEQGGSPESTSAPSTDNGQASTAARQTQGKTFGERVSGGLHSGAGALSQGAGLREDNKSPHEHHAVKPRHETSMNSIGNVR